MLIVVYSVVLVFQNEFTFNPIQNTVYVNLFDRACAIAKRHQMVVFIYFIKEADSTLLVNAGHAFGCNLYVFVNWTVDVAVLKKAVAVRCGLAAVEHEFAYEELYAAKFD